MKARAALVLLLLSASQLPAQQVRSGLVLGGVRVRYADALDVSAVLVSPSITFQSGQRVLGLTGTLSQPTLGPWSAQGQISGSSFRVLTSRFAVEVGGIAGGSTSADETRTGHARALVRAHLTAVRTGTWLGGGVGRAWNGASWQPTGVTELGVWAQSNLLGVVATYSPTVASDSVRYADAQLSFRARGTRLELDGVIGNRSGAARAAGISDPASWASLSASLRVSARLAIVASGGSYPLDLLEGFPSGRFASLGIRLSGPGSGPSPEFARATVELERDRLVRSGVGVLRLRRIATGRYELRVRAGGARLLEITGDVTGWTTVPMTSAPDGWWTIVVDGEPGTHELNVRRDGGAWVVPTGLPERRDEFGSVSGVITLR